MCIQWFCTVHLVSIVYREMSVPVRQKCMLKNSWLHFASYCTTVRTSTVQCTRTLKRAAPASYFNTRRNTHVPCTLSFFPTVYLGTRQRMSTSSILQYKNKKCANFLSIWIWEIILALLTLNIPVLLYSLLILSIEHSWYKSYGRTWNQVWRIV